MEYYHDQGALMDDEGRFTPLFWEQHPDSAERAELRDWVDGAWAVAAEAVVHKYMGVDYQKVQGEISAAKTEIQGLVETGVAPNVGAAVADETVEKPIDLDVERARRRPAAAEDNTFPAQAASR